MVDAVTLTTALLRESPVDNRIVKGLDVAYGRSTVTVRRSKNHRVWISAILNVPKIVNGHNVYLQPPDVDSRVLVGTVALLSECLPDDLSNDLAAWHVQRVELSRDVGLDDPVGFVERCFRRHDGGGAEARLTLQGRGATCELKLKSYKHRVYAKGAEVLHSKGSPVLCEASAQVVRYELVAFSRKLRSLGSLNRLDRFCQGLTDGRLGAVLDKNWEQTIGTVPTVREGFEEFVMDRLRGSELRNVLAYQTLTDRFGALEAASRLGWSASTVSRTRALLRECIEVFNRHLRMPTNQPIS